MSMRAAVVGAGPNGLVAACVLARAGWEVVLYDAAPAPGGALRSEELFGPGIISDLGASVHPLNLASPAFQELFGEPGGTGSTDALNQPNRGGFAAAGLEWKHPQIPAAHGYDDDAPVLLHRSLQETSVALGADARRWKALMGPVAENWDAVRRAAFTPPSRPYSLRGVNGPPQSAESVLARTAALLQIGARGVLPAAVTAKFFGTDRARALFAGLAAHSTASLAQPMTSVFGVVLGAAAHAGGWPFIAGGSQRMVDALVAIFASHGGRVETGFTVQQLHRHSGGLRPSGDRAPGEAGREGNRWTISGIRAARGRRDRKRTADEQADAVVLDLSPQQMLKMQGLPLPDGVERAMRRWDYGPGVVKLDYLIDGPIPWSHPAMAKAGTVHLGGSAAQIAASESAAVRGVLSGRPYVLLTQPSSADSTRTPDDRTVAWAYAHVPRGLDAHGTQRAVKLIEDEISRQAPQFREAVLERKVWGPDELESWNPNLVEGTISGGVPSLLQTVSRPARPLHPYTTGVEGVYMCSASTPPGGGAHGMGGWNAAHTLLENYR